MNQQFNPDHYLNPNFYDLIKQNKSFEINLNDKIQKLEKLSNSENLIVIENKSYSFINEKIINLNHEKSLTILSTVQNSHSYNKYTINVFNDCDIFILTLPTKNQTKTNINIYLHNPLKLTVNVFCETEIGQLCDDSINIKHNSPSSQSDLRYVSYSNGKNVSQINSEIPEFSKHCETHQHIKHTLLNERAIALSKPSLTIKNPDVVASHGNSIGAISEEDLSYLFQRGLSYDKAIYLIKQSDYLNIISKHPHFDILKDLYEQH